MCGRSSRVGPPSSRAADPVGPVSAREIPAPILGAKDPRHAGPGRANVPVWPSKRYWSGRSRPSGSTSIIGPDRAQRFNTTAGLARDAFDGRVVNVNSTATGGGVAELLQTLLAYARGRGVDARWVVVDGDAAFFEITKRIHNHLYGTPGDGGPLGAAEHDHYEKTLLRNARRVRDVVAPRRRRASCTIRRPPGWCRTLARPVRSDRLALPRRNRRAERALRPGVGLPRAGTSTASTHSCSRRAVRPAVDPAERVVVISPSIDPFSAKNETIDAGERRSRAATRRAALGGALTPGRVVHSTRRIDGVAARRSVDLLGTGPPPTVGTDRAPGVALGCDEGHARRDDRVRRGGRARLGRATSCSPVRNRSGVADDPEAVAVLRDCLQAWNGSRTPIRNRVHLVCVPMDDPDEAAAMVNVVQRHARSSCRRAWPRASG